MRLLNAGTYLLILELISPTNVKVRSGKTFVLEPGYYGYVGSALNDLGKRIDRHLSTKKKLYWHIDYLRQIASVQSIIFAESDKRNECLFAQNLILKHQYVSGFGCSDCRCKSHLVYSSSIEELTDNALAAFKLSNPELAVNDGEVKQLHTND